MALTQETFFSHLPLLNLRAVCARSGVPYTRAINAKRGTGTPLTPEELKKIENILKTLTSDPPNSKD